MKNSNWGAGWRQVSGAGRVTKPSEYLLHTVSAATSAIASFLSECSLEAQTKEQECLETTQLLIRCLSFLPLSPAFFLFLSMGSPLVFQVVQPRSGGMVRNKWVPLLSEQRLHADSSRQILSTLFIHLYHSSARTRCSRFPVQSSPLHLRLLSFHFGKAPVPSLAKSHCSYDFPSSPTPHGSLVSIMWP